MEVVASMRAVLLAGNWKMHKTLAEGEALAKEIIAGHNPSIATILLPSFLHLSRIGDLLRETSSLYLGAQCVYHRKEGAYTGAISCSMLVSAGISHVLVGHSERREWFGEAKADILFAQMESIIAMGMIPIFCCGESLAMRQKGEEKAAIHAQLQVLTRLSKAQMGRFVLAYEPIWAIGTGQVATTHQAERMHAYIRSLIAHEKGQALAEAIPILYGGSVTPENADGLFKAENIDGALVGGASLTAKSFLAIQHHLAQNKRR